MEERLNNIWQFSASSLPHLQRFKDVVDTKIKNKWTEKFKFESQTIDAAAEESMIYESCDELPPDTVIEEANHECFIRDFIDVDPIKNFDEIVEKCLQTPNLFYALAEKLPHGSTEKLCNYVFNTDVNKLFLENFYKLFLPVIFKKEFSIELLLKSYKCDEFKILLELILLDKGIPVNVLQEFVKILDNVEKTKFITYIINTEIPNELLVYNLFAIYLAYKDCNNTQEIQNYIHSKLTQTAEICEHEKNYGHLLLTYIRTIKDLDKAKDVEKLVHLHKSVFKRACLNSLNAIVNK